MMRRIFMLAAMAVMASCGSSPDENAARVEGKTPAQSPEVVNAPDLAEPQAGNAAAPVSNAVAGSASPCMVQGSEQIRVKPLRAIGTEPFWSARVEGRCVTYSTPEDQQGTRVWTRYTPGTGGGGEWIGQLGGKSFELRTRPEPGCSDGMSDNRYPIAVDLRVNGELRRGCAEEL